MRGGLSPLLHHPFFTGLRSRESANKYPKNKNDNFRSFNINGLPVNALVPYDFIRTFLLTAQERADFWQQQITAPA